MAIHASKTGFRSSAQFPDFKVAGTLSTGQVLVFDSVVRAFVNRDQSILSIAAPGSSSTGIQSATNLGAGARVFENIDINDQIKFRSITGGIGITVTEDGINFGEIDITNDIITTGIISVVDKFDLEIDNDNTTASSAKFQIFTNTNPANVVLTPITLNSQTDITVVTDPLFVDPGQFVTAGGDFVAAGFIAGMCLEVSGTTEQDGIWEIATVTTSTITITIPFPDATDAGLQPSTSFGAIFFKIIDNQTIRLLTRDVAVDGFLNNQTLNLTGTTDNDGTYSINTATGTDITIVETFPGTVGCDVGTITLSVPAVKTTTGWWVNELGQMNSNDITVDGNLITINNGNITIDGTLTVGGNDLDTIIDGRIPTAGTDGILVQTAALTVVGRLLAEGNAITITDPDGIAGDPTINVADDATFPGLGAIRIPNGTTAQRPGAPLRGMIRYNTDNEEVEVFVNSSWQTFIDDTTGPFLPLIGGTLTGAIVMDDQNITFTTGLVDTRDVSADGTILDNINTGTGIKVQTAADTFVNRTATSAANSGIVITNGDGVAGDPTFDFDISTVTALVGEEVDMFADSILIYDDSNSALRKIKPHQINNRDAKNYFMAQI